MSLACPLPTLDLPFLFMSADTDVEMFEYDHIPSPSSPSSSPYASSDFDSDSEGDDEDEEEHNHRVAPHWESYRHLLESHGYHLDTCKDVRQFYLHYWEARNVQQNIETCAGYQSACRDGRGDNELCKDEGLPERLFRGKRVLDGLPIVIKAVHRWSRELDVITALSTPPLRDHPMNHCIPVLDIIHAPSDFPHSFPYAVHRDQLSFIIMQEWSSQFTLPDQLHTLRSYLNSLRHCIQHIAFMHANHFAHLDIAARNVLTDYAGHYAYIDYETSRRFFQPPVDVEEGGDPRNNVLIYQPRATHVPPEVENGYSTSPYAMDVWALGMVISKASTSTGYAVPELFPVIKGMLDPRWERRPSAKTVLRRFEEVILRIPEDRLKSTLSSHPAPAVSS